jgi:hypothetical protein
MVCGDRARISGPTSFGAFEAILALLSPVATWHGVEFVLPLWCSSSNLPRWVGFKVRRMR